MNKDYKIHSFYILLILVSIIIGLVSVNWSQVPKLVEYITFALTVSSLILAILAIVYSVYSNSSISELMGEISIATKDVVGHAAKEGGKFVASASNVVKRTGTTRAM